MIPLRAQYRCGPSRTADATIFRISPDPAERGPWQAIRSIQMKISNSVAFKDEDVRHTLLEWYGVEDWNWIDQVECTDT